jgi:hypothetical protein
MNCFQQIYGIDLMAKKKKKNKNNCPKRKKMCRKSRLIVAKKWLVSCDAKTVVKAYRKWFGVDFPCAFTELEMLGVKIDPLYKEQVLKGVEGHNLSKKRKKQEKENDWLEDSDEYFACIVGYTSGGAPYGVEWEETLSGEGCIPF